MSDPLAQLEELLQQLPAALDAKQLGDSLTGAVRASESAAPAVARMEAWTPLLPLVAKGLRSNRVAMDRALAALSVVSTAAASAARQEELRALAERLNTVSERVDDLAALVKQAWQDHVEQFKRYESLADFLMQIPAQHATGRQLAVLARSLQRTRSFPPSAADLTTVAGAPQAIAEACEALNSASDDLARFLLELVSGRATVQDLSPEILGWLADNKIGNAVSLTLQRR